MKFRNYRIPLESVGSEIFGSGLSLLNVCRPGLSLLNVLRPGPGRVKILPDGLWIS